MKAAYFEKTGPARDVLKIGDLPDPSPKEGEVLVRVRVSGVNPSDVKTRGGSSGRPSPDGEHPSAATTRPREKKLRAFMVSFPPWWAAFVGGWEERAAAEISRELSRA